MSSPRTTRSSLCSPQLEKAHRQQQRPNAAKDKIILKKKEKWERHMFKAGAETRRWALPHPALLGASMPNSNTLLLCTSPQRTVKAQCQLGLICKKSANIASKYGDSSACVGPPPRGPAKQQLHTGRVLQGEAEYCPGGDAASVLTWLRPQVLAQV